MKKALLKFLKIFLPLALGVILIYYSYIQFSQDQLDEIKKYLIDANYYWVALGMFLALCSHLSRAWRWNYMLAALDHRPKFIHNIAAIGAGYAMNMLIPRSGEVSRAVIVNRTDGIPIDQSIGTIIAERVLDFVILLIITLTAIILSGDLLLNFLVDGFNSAFAKAETSTLLLILTSLVVLIAFLFFLFKKLGLTQKIAAFVSGIKEGMMTIWTMEKKWSYLAHTIFIWVMYLAMFYVSTFAIPAVNDLSIAALLCAFVAGSFAVAFTNGGFGAYPLLIAKVLLLFSIPETIGTALGWILWISQTALILVYGLISMLLLSFLGAISSK